MRANEVPRWRQPEGTQQQSHRTGAVPRGGVEIRRRAWTVEYKGRAQGKQCTGKNDTCKGWKTQGSELCIGCQNHEAKMAKVG